MKKNNEYKFILEETNTVSFSDLKILEETTVNNKPKLAFEASLQYADEKNNNRRIYSSAICENIVSVLSPKSNNRSLLMEIDHPMFVSGDPEILKKRAGIVEVNNAAAVLRKISFKNGQILGEIETLSGFKGPDLANLITKDKINIGFSLRALGSVEPLSDGTLMVKAPIMPITYDVVSNPSYTNARVMDFLPESSNEYMSYNGNLLCESDEMVILHENGITIDNGNSVLTFLNEIIDDRFLNIISNGIRFKI